MVVKRILRATGLTALAVGAVGSVGLTLYAGRHNHSVILMALFTLWVLSPFAALALLHSVSKGRAAFHSLMVILTLASLAIYAYIALGPPRVKTAPVFVVVPPVSWLIIAIVVLISLRLKGSRPD